MGIFVSLQSTSAKNAVAAKDAFEPQFFLHTPSGPGSLTQHAASSAKPSSSPASTMFSQHFAIPASALFADAELAYFPEEIESCIRALPQSSGIASGEISGIRQSCSSSIHLLCCRLAQHILQVLCTASKRSRSRRANHH